MQPKHGKFQHFILTMKVPCVLSCVQQVVDGNYGLGDTHGEFQYFIPTTIATDVMNCVNLF